MITLTKNNKTNYDITNILLKIFNILKTFISNNLSVNYCVFNIQITFKIITL